MVTIAIFFIILVVLVLVHEFGHFIVAKKNGIKVEEFGFGFPPRIFGKKIGETLYSINLIPLGGFVKLYGEEYHELEGKTKIEKEKLSSQAFVNKKPFQKAQVIVAGVIMNFLRGWMIVSYLFTSGITVPNGVSIIKIQENSPAYSAGLKANDSFVKIVTENEVLPITTSSDLISATKKYADKNILLVVKRADNAMYFKIIPRSNPPLGEGSLGVVIDQNLQVLKYPWYQAPFYGLAHSYKMTKTILVEILKIPVQLISKHKTSVEFSGPVGIAKVIGQARKYGINAILEITAVISLNLAVINILPFPALDGGRMIFVIYEFITGKRSNQNFEKYLNFVGIILLLSLSVLITFLDIKKYL